MEHLIKLTPENGKVKVEKILADHIPKLKDFYELIHCNYIEVHEATFRIGWNIYKVLMVMDEEALLHETIPEENVLASYLFTHSSKCLQQVFGTVILAMEDGEEIISFDTETADMLVDDLKTFPIAH